MGDLHFVQSSIFKVLTKQLHWISVKNSVAGNRIFLPSLSRGHLRVRTPAQQFCQKLPCIASLAGDNLFQAS